MTIRIVPYKEARLDYFKAQRERRKKTLHWWKYQKPYKQYDQQTIWTCVPIWGMKSVTWMM